MKVSERKRQQNWLSSKYTIDNSLPDLSNHPVVLKKAQRAREFLDKHPIPEDLFKK